MEPSENPASSDDLWGTVVPRRPPWNVASSPQSSMARMDAAHLLISDLIINLFPHPCSHCGSRCSLAARSMQYELMQS